MVIRPTERLGMELRHARREADRSLRAVAEEAGISAAYLQKLERGVPASPSPNILRRLAAVLGLSYERLLASAGFTPPAPTSRGSSLEAMLASAQLSQVEERAVEAFVAHLIKSRHGRSDGEVGTDDVDDGGSG